MWLMPFLLRATQRLDLTGWPLRSEVNLAVTGHSRDTPGQTPNATNHATLLHHIIHQGNMRFLEVDLSVSDDGQIDASLGADWPMFNHALSDSISSLPPRGRRGMRWRWIGAGVLACASVACSAEHSPLGASSAPTNVTAASAVEQHQTSVPAPASTVAETTTAVPTVVDTVATPVLPESATVDDDGTVSWNYESPLIDQRVRRYILDPAPDGLVVSEGGETPTNLPAARALTGIFATGGEADPLVTVTITSPAVTGDTPTLDGVSGEPVMVGDVAAVQRSLGVTGVGLAFVLGGHRVDVVARVAVQQWLAPLAASVTIDGPLVSVRVPEGSGLTFVGAYSPATPAADGFDLIGLYYRAQSTFLGYGDGDGEVLLSVSAGRIVNLESLRAWLEPRGEPIEVAGRPGWIVRVTNSDSIVVEWFVDGLAFQLGGNVPEDELLALVAGVRPATDDEWAQVSQAF